MTIEKEKLDALNHVLGKIEKDFGKGSIMRLGEASSMVVDSISTGSIGLDIAVGIGGLPRGRIVEIYGPESSGKTTVALHSVAEAQKNGGIAAFIDAEHALDPVYARALGVDVEDRNRLSCSVSSKSRDRRRYGRLSRRFTSQTYVSSP